MEDERWREAALTFGLATSPTHAPRPASPISSTRQRRRVARARGRVLPDRRSLQHRRRLSGWAAMNRAREDAAGRPAACKRLQPGLFVFGTCSDKPPLRLDFYQMFRSCRQYFIITLHTPLHLPPHSAPSLLTTPLSTAVPSTVSPACPPSLDSVPSAPLLAHHVSVAVTQRRKRLPISVDAERVDDAASRRASAVPTRAPAQCLDTLQVLHSLHLALQRGRR